MENNTSITAQERIAATWGSIFFFVPFLLNQVTEFTLIYMRQNFFLFIVNIVICLLAVLIPFLESIVYFLGFVVGIIAVWLAIQAWKGQRFTYPYLYDWSLGLIRVLHLEQFFSVKK